MKRRVISVLFVALLGLLSFGCSVIFGSSAPVVWITYVPQASTSLLSLSIDFAGNKWIGTEGQGVLVLSADNQRWASTTTPGGKEANTVVSIVFDREGNRWIVTPVGVAVVNPEGQTVESYSTGLELPASPQHLGIDSAGRVWIATWGGGVAVLDRESNTWTTYTTADGLIDNRVRFVRIDGLNNKWFGTAAGVALLTADGEWKSYGAESGFGRGPVWAMVGDIDGNLWCATQGGGVVVLDPEGQRLATYTTEHGLPDNRVYDVMIDTLGQKWIATANGLAVLGRDNRLLAVFTAQNGLGSNVVTGLSLDPKGNVWAVTYGGGVSVYAPPQR
jgi:ligand-binding sensor domain-containing protein